MNTRRVVPGLSVLFLLLVALSVLGLGSAQDNTLIIARPTDAVTLDPYEEGSAPGSNVYSNITESLVRITTDMKIVPCLATSWEVTSPTSLRFYLREGVPFHDGTPFTASAVKFTFDRALFGERKAWWAAFGAENIKEVVIVDDYTVDFIMHSPYGPILTVVIGQPAAGIISPTAVAQYGEEYARHPVGTGPFVFKEWKAQYEIVVVANEDYWGGRPALDKVIFRVIPEEGSRTLSLKTGEVDIVLKPAPVDLLSFRDDPNVQLVEAYGLRTFSLWFNLSIPPMDDIRVRHAIAYAIDTHTIVEDILEGAAMAPTTSILTPGILGSYGWPKEQMYPYDPQKALDLLDSAGWVDADSDGFLDRGGEELVLRYLPANGRDMKDLEIAQVIEAQLRAVGIRIEMDVYEWATTLSKWMSAEFPYELHSFGWGTAGDPDYTLPPAFLSDKTPPDGWNSCRYSNAEVDRLINLGRVTLDDEKRKIIYARAQSIIAADLPVLPLYMTKEVALASAAVKGFSMHPMEYYLDLYPIHF